ncbi:TAXI family TRAP transporter solute-binding subunit [Halobellus rufus]|uniref:TAXI family TRAP transporter solute-binding subunit n=1 Tax=Halobellus rufus TaxID=1448860 RepID=UPI0012E05CE8|nr:TAXI family TRAP transporter solute-binding subunit [Halobellus rufus]
MTMRTSLTRRESLKTIGGVGALAGLAGCSGGSGDGGGGGGDGGGGDSSSDGEQTDGGSQSDPESTSTFGIISGPQNGVTFLVHNAAAGVLDRESDVGLDVVSGTSGESMVRLVSGDEELAFGTAFAGLNAMNREAEFSQVEFEHEIYQMMTQTTLIEPILVPTDSDYEYWSDLEGASIATGTQGSTYQQYYRTALDIAVGEGNYELVHQGATEIPQEFSAGRVDAMGGPGIVSGLTPGFMQQAYSDNDVRLLGLTDETEQAIEDHEWLSLETLPNGDFGDSIEEYTDSSETTTVRVDYPHFTTDKVDADSVYNLMDALWSNREALIEAHEAWRLFEDDEVWTSTLHPDVPVHPGAVEFFEEKGLWNDNLTAGSF